MTTPATLPPVGMPPGALHAVDPYPADALHACQVLSRLLSSLPRPESVQIFTASHWSAPWLQVHLYPDPDDVQMLQYQRAFGGEVTCRRRELGEEPVIYSELATVVDRVRVQVWNVNAAPPRPPDESDDADNADNVDDTGDADDPGDTSDPGDPV
ncbi:hypothetical protein [Streptacidiphilus fuscans]|uniref:Uncharacterized protein n=1 Tax=Streptacidiphilus fuscans TaxID=2789292 RepID=A0A931B1X9_9ACTN|nr:hypothetical protein [Streptacidiphilus fuscans]MBF9069599.1 hypothetical protein [Streptacidiphilus fuscans]